MSHHKHRDTVVNDVAAIGHVTVRWLPADERVFGGGHHYLIENGCGPDTYCTGDELDNFAMRLALLLAAHKEGR